MCMLCDDEKAYQAYMNYLDAMERQGKAADPDKAMDAVLDQLEAAGISRPIRTACPAQRLVKSTRPSFSAAAFSGPSAVAAWGNAGASGETGPTSRITRLATPRAGRPVMTLVMTVESSSA